jgi:hypothetical protein
MNPSELVDQIRSGLVELELLDPLRFRRRTRSNPCDFNDFIQALQSSETIRSVTCRSQRHLGITEDEWVLLVETLGRIKDIQCLNLYCTFGSRDFHPLQAVANALNNAQSLHKLEILQEREPSLRDASELSALVDALQGHAALEEFSWFDHCSPREVAQITAIDPVLCALQACPHLRKVVIMTKCASFDAIKNLLQLHSATDLRLVLEMNEWLAVTDEIRRGRYNVRKLALNKAEGTRSEATEAIKAVASAIRMDCKMESLVLRIEEVCFSDEAGVVLAEALAVNKTLRKIIIILFENTLGALVYEAFSVMLRANAKLAMEFPLFRTAGANERLHESREQMAIEQRLNQVGRGKLLASTQTTRGEWLDALNELNSTNVEDSPLANVDDSHACQVGCLYRLLRLNPSVVSQS